MSKLDKTVAKFKAWVTATSTLAQTIVTRIVIEAVCFALASAAAVLIVIYSKAILIIFFELISLLSKSGVQIDVSTNTGSKPFEGARNIAFALTALVGGPFLVWRTILADKQTRTAQKQTAIAQEKASIDEQMHYTTLYTKSIEQLGAMRVVKDDKGKDVSEPAMEIRLGAIYALERIAHESEIHHWPIMELLSAYIKETASYGQGRKNIIRQDGEAILNVIGRRNPVWIKSVELKHDYQINLSQIFVYSLNTFENLNFANTNFSRSCLFSRSFKNVNFTKSNLHKTEFKTLSFKNCDFTAADMEHTEIEHFLASPYHQNISSDMKYTGQRTFMIFCNFKNSNLGLHNYENLIIKNSILLFSIFEIINPKIDIINCVSFKNKKKCFVNSEDNYFMGTEDISSVQASHLFEVTKDNCINVNEKIYWPDLIKEAKKQS